MLKNRLNYQSKQIRLKGGETYVTSKSL